MRAGAQNMGTSPGLRALTCLGGGLLFRWSSEKKKLWNLNFKGVRKGVSHCCILPSVNCPSVHGFGEAPSIRYGNSLWFSMNLASLIMSEVNLPCVTSWLCSWAGLQPGNMFKLVLNQDHSGSMASVKTQWPSWVDWICLPTLRCWSVILDQCRSVHVRQQGTAHQDGWIESCGIHPFLQLWGKCFSIPGGSVSPSWLMQFPLCSRGSDSVE